MARTLDELNKEEFAELKQRYESGEPLTHLRDEFGLNSTVGLMAHGKSQGWVRDYVDLAAMEVDFRTGILTNAEIARKHGVTRQAVHAFATENDWQRDISDEIREQAAARNREEIARDYDAALATKRGEIYEAAVIEANATIQSKITREHQRGASTAREAAVKLMKEMSALAIPEADLMQFVEVAVARQTAGIEDFDAQDKAREKAMETFIKLVGLGGRSSALKNLVGALSQAIDTERKVYGIKDEQGETDVTKALRELAGNA